MVGRRVVGAWAVAWVRRCCLHTTRRVCIPTEAMRTLGIIAHIDAGKTTLTERILTLTQRGLEAPTHAAATYVAPGDVDSGSTVTDFLEEERERGITIQSAAVGPIWWRDMAMTLVDTPGHIDFGIEVERAVRVVDGTIVVLDGVEGVEPQSENVWRQAKRYGVDAHLFFVNKLDRPGACISRSVRSIIDAGLHERPVLLQLPAYAADVGESDASGDRPLVGVVDLLSLHVWRFRGVAGERMEAVPLEASMPVYERALLARQALIDTLGSLDDDLLEHIVMLDEGEAVDVSLVQAALRRLTLAGRVCPVLCGAAAVNIGVQPLLDAVHRYLPSPADRPHVRGVLEPDTPRAREVDVALSDSTPAALAFKVVWDRRRGPITFVKVYAGTLHAAQSVINTTGRHKERLARLLLPYADEYVDVRALHAGQIGVVLGLRDTRTGDTLVGSPAWRTLRLRRVHVPPPVFSASIEPRSKAEEGAVQDALQMLVRTDPSLHVTHGTQTVLSGMGELHLDIAHHRLTSEFGVQPRLGHVRVGYRETLTEAVEATSDEPALSVRVALSPAAGEQQVAVDVGDMPEVDGVPVAHLVQQGIRAALARGPRSGYPMHGVQGTVSVRAKDDDLPPAASIRQAVVQTIRRALGGKSGPTRLMEPMMHVTIEAPSTHAGALSTDISVEQHGSILDMQLEAQQDTPTYQVYLPPTDEAAQAQDQRMTIHAHIPLARMVRYSSRLRALTGGAGSHTMALHGFDVVSPERERELLAELGR